MAGRLRRGRPTAQAQEVARHFVKHIRQSEQQPECSPCDGGGSHLLRRVTADFPPQQVSLAGINKCNGNEDPRLEEKVPRFKQRASATVYVHCSANVCGHKVALNDQSGHSWLHRFVV